MFCSFRNAFARLMLAVTLCTTTVSVANAEDHHVPDYYYKYDTVHCVDAFVPSQQARESVLALPYVPYFTHARASAFVAASENDESGDITAQAISILECLETAAVETYDKTLRLSQIVKKLSDDPYRCAGDFKMLILELAILEAAFRPGAYEWQVAYADFLITSDHGGVWCDQTKNYFWPYDSDLGKRVVETYTAAGLESDAVAAGQKMAWQQISHLYYTRSAYSDYTTYYDSSGRLQYNYLVRMGELICDRKPHNEVVGTQAKDVQLWLSYFHPRYAQMKLRAARIHATKESCHDRAASIEKLMHMF